MLCSPPPSAISPASPPPSPASASRCAAKPKSASRSAPCSTSTRWPSTSPSTLPTPVPPPPARTAEITAEAALDGLYVVRTSLPAAALDDTATVKSYKSLSLVERAFRCIKTVDLQIRPVYHWLTDRVRAHVFLCMLAYYLEW